MFCKGFLHILTAARHLQAIITPPLRWRNQLTLGTAALGFLGGVLVACVTRESIRPESTSYLFPYRCAGLHRGFTPYLALIFASRLLLSSLALTLFSLVWLSYVALVFTLVFDPRL